MGKLYKKKHNNLKKLLDKYDIKHTLLMRHLGCTYACIYTYLSHKRHIPPSVAKKIIEFFKKNGVSVDYNDIYDNGDI